MINNNYTYEDNDESSSNRSSILLSPNNDSSINENKMSFLDTSNSPSPTTPQALYFYNPYYRSIHANQISSDNYSLLKNRKLNNLSF